MSQSPDVVVQSGRPVLNNDQLASDDQPAWERNLKRGLAMLVAGATGVVSFLSPTEDAVALKACAIIIGIGAALGITSSGNPKKAARK